MEIEVVLVLMFLSIVIAFIMVRQSYMINKDEIQKSDKKDTLDSYRKEFETDHIEDWDNFELDDEGFYINSTLQHTFDGYVMGQRKAKKKTRPQNGSHEDDDELILRLKTRISSLEETRSSLQEDLSEFNYQNMTAHGKNEKLKSEIQELRDLINEANMAMADLNGVCARSDISKNSSTINDVNEVQLKWRKKAGFLNDQE